MASTLVYGDDEQSIGSPSRSPSPVMPLADVIRLAAAPVVVMSRSATPAMTLADVLRLVAIPAIMYYQEQVEWQDEDEEDDEPMGDPTELWWAGAIQF